jgi:hypothetical protein
MGIRNLDLTGPIEDIEIETVKLDGKLVWRFPDGSTFPVVRGGAVDDDDDDDDADDDDADDQDDDQDDDDSEEDGDDEDDDQEDDDQDDDEEDWQARFEDLEANFQAELDRRINRLTRTLRREFAGGEDDEPRGGRGKRRRRRQQDDDGDLDFSDRDARLAATELIRDELPRMTSAEREISRSLLAEEIRKRRTSGDDEDTVGEDAAQKVIELMKASRTAASRSSTRKARKKGEGAKPQRKKGTSSTSRSTKSSFELGAQRAAARRPPTKE